MTCDLQALLEALREAAAAEIDQLRRASLESKRKAALDKRQQILNSMGMKLHGGAAAEEESEGAAASRSATSRSVIVSSSAAALMEELAEESGHTCVVCGEGEAYRPGETLGCYTFTKRVPLHGTGGDGGAAGLPLPSLGLPSGLTRQEQCYTTVTHFNIIHVQCHREASAAERTLKQPKEAPTPAPPPVCPAPLRCAWRTLCPAPCAQS